MSATLARLRNVTQFEMPSLFCAHMFIFKNPNLILLTHQNAKLSSPLFLVTSLSFQLTTPAGG